MGASIEDHFMADGRWSLDLKYDPDLNDDLRQKAHVLLYDPDGNLFDVGVLTSKVASQGVITVGGPRLPWWLGSGAVGPLIIEREFISAKQRLENGDFELNVFGEPFDFWSTGGDSEWLAAVGTAHGGSAGAAYVNGDPLKDDVLVSESAAELQAAKPGQQFYLETYIYRPSGTTGHLWWRIVFTGRFVNPTTTDDYSTWGANVRGDIVLGTDPTGAITGPTFNVHTGIPNLVVDGSFDLGIAFTGWVQLPTALDWDIDTDGGHNGPNYAFTDGGPAWKELVAPAITVVEGESYEFWVVGRINPGSPATDGEAHMMVGMAGGPTVDDFIKTSTIKNDNGVGSWQLVKGSVTVDAGRTVLRPQVVVEDESAGRWDFDDLTVIRVKGNIDTREAPPITDLIPERTYRWTVPYRADLGVSAGRVQLQATVYGVDRPSILLTGPELRQPNDDPNVQMATWDITPPSGYTGIIRRVYVEDVTGGTVYVGQGTVDDTDTTTRVYGAQSNETEPVWTPVATGVVTAPEGTEGVHVEIVAEAGAGGWLVDDVVFIRFTASPATIADVVESLLLNPDTGLPMTVIAGTIHDGSTVIDHDWLVKLAHVRDALGEFARVVANQREWYIDPATRELEFGLPEQVFTDHAPDSADPYILLEDDMDVIGGLPPVEENSESRASKVLLIGAERPNVFGGPPSLVQALADAGTDEVDWDQNPVTRTRVVEDPSIGHRNVALARAQDEADSEATTRTLSLSVVLTAKADPDTGVVTRNYGKRPGDWVYPYKPESGLVDPLVEVEVEGRTVWPKKVRILSRTVKPGNGWTAKLRKLDGTLVDLTGAMWENEESTTLELGDPRPEFTNDPQGGSVEKRYLAWRKSRTT